MAKHLIGILYLALSLFIAGCVVAERPVVVRTPPPVPPPITEVIPGRPGPAHVWVPGHWAWRGPARGYVWVAGHWAIPERPEYVWVPGHWQERRGEYVWIEGHWQPRR